MRLLATTTILWAAGTALAHRDRESGKSTKERTAPGNSFGDDRPDDNVFQAGGSAVHCKISGITEGNNLIVFVPAFSQAQPSPGSISIQFDCTWSDGKLGRVIDAKLRRFTLPTPTVVAASNPSAATSSNPAGTTPTAPGGAAPGGAGGDGSSAVKSPVLGESSVGNPVTPVAGPTGAAKPFPTGIVHGRRESMPLISVDPRPFSNLQILRIEGIADGSSLISKTEAMYLEIAWQMNNGANSNGASAFTSYSHLFGILRSTDSQADLIKAVPFPGIGSTYLTGTVADDKDINQATSDIPKPSSTNANDKSGGLGGSGSGSPGGDNSPNGGNIASNVPVPEAQAAPSGLPTGTIAGIAVGAVVGGLLLIGALVFFLLRRRRRQQGDHVSNARPYARDQHTATADLMGEKEAAAGGMGETPHSPYSDDGHGSLPRGMAAPGPAAGMAAGAGAHHGSPSAPAPADMHRSSFTPYSDDGTAVPPVDRATGARSETPGGGRYEHLMEQGMSAEDRARVEEEERQLDAEIERARK